MGIVEIQWKKKHSRNKLIKKNIYKKRLLQET